ncbi:hypothetical protein BX616_006745, partial [Lobosporangium transversale]
MTSTMRPLPQLRIIQQQFDRKDKRLYSSTVNSSDEDADSRKTLGTRYSDSASSNHTSSSEPSAKVRRKPGRKPNPASPAVRKEQNRAAQRAFRDRKERHLQEMEAMIKDLQEKNSQMNMRIQQDTQQFKTTVESLQSENYYLRHVVFSFETTLHKGGNMAILQEVKAEFYRRHYDRHARKQLSDTISSSQEQRTPMPTTPSIFLPNGHLPLQVLAEESQQLLHQKVVSAPVTAPVSPDSVSPPSTSTTAIIPTSLPSSPKSTISATLPTTSPTNSAFENISSYSSSPVSTRTVSSTLMNEPVDQAMDPDNATLFPINDGILCNEPSLVCMLEPDDGKSVRSITTCEPPVASRLFFTEAGTYLAKRATEYTKHASVFDELQSSLFPPGTLQSIIRTDLATPQEIVNDVPLLEQLHDHFNHHRRPPLPLRDPVIAPAQATITYCTTAIDAGSPTDPTSILDEDGNEFDMATPTLGLDDGLKQNVIPSKRLQLEIQVLASAPPVVDPNIDPKVYALPHDSRIDLIPCPRLRAQMILHQKSFDVEDLCRVLINGARCHGHPLDPHSWELPEEFFNRYGFLLGEEMLRHRNKVWPKKDEPLP